MNPGLGAARPAALIAIVGAESCGKSTLARTLTARLRADGLEAVCIDEYLREFCEQHGRTPRPDEQAAIAAEQSRRIAAARHARLLPVDVVVADTTALMTAVYSELIFGDRSLHEAALAAHRQAAQAVERGQMLRPVGQGTGGGVRGGGQGGRLHPIDAATSCYAWADRASPCRSHAGSPQRPQT